MVDNGLELSPNNEPSEQSPENNQWSKLGDEVPFAGNVIKTDNTEQNTAELSSAELSNAGEPWEDFPDDYEGVDNAEDIDGVPQTMWRGERYYLDNIDELGQRSLSTKGHEALHNQQGKVYTARDKKYASLYAVGTDGVTFYDKPLPVEQIPIGVIFKINNANNHLGSTPTSDTPDSWGPFEGRFREFVSEEIPPEDCEVTDIYIMDDFVANDPRISKNGEGFSQYKTGGHVRSDLRRPMEVYKVKNQSELPAIIDKVKKRMAELDKDRKT